MTKLKLNLISSTYRKLQVNTVSSLNLVLRYSFVYNAMSSGRPEFDDRVSKAACPLSSPPLPPPRARGEDSEIKVAGMLVVSLKGVNHGFCFHRCSPVFTG